MCDKCKATQAKTRHRVQDIDWSRIPAQYNEVRETVGGDLMASPAFRVTIQCGRLYEYREAFPALGLWNRSPVVATRPVRKDYVIRSPGLLPDFVVDATVADVQAHLTNAGYGPDIRVYALTLVAEPKEVVVQSTHTELVWSK